MRKSGLSLTVLFLLVAGAGTYLALRPSAEPTPAIDEVASAVDDAEDAAAPVLLAAGGQPTDPRRPTGSHTLAGKVLDLAGVPVAGVRVTATRTGPGYDPDDPSSWPSNTGAAAGRKRLEALDVPVAGEPKSDAETVSGADGAFSMAVQEVGAYTVRAVPGAPRVGSLASVQLLARKPADRIWLRVSTGVPLAGRVVDAADRPVVGAVVTGGFTAREASASWLVFGVTTAADGTFSWDAVPPGTCSATVAVPGRGTYSGFGSPAPRTDPWVLRLPAAGTIRGRIADAAGVGIADVDLVVSTRRPSPTSPSGASELKGRSGPDGAYRIEGVSPGPVAGVWLLPSGAHLAEYQSPPRAIWSGAEVKAGEDLVLDLLLSRGGAIEVTVVGDDGAPLEGAEVTALGSQSSAGTGARPAPPTATDREGRARLEGLALGRYVLHVRHATHYQRELEQAPRSFEVAADGTPVTAGPPPALVAVLAKEGDVARKVLQLTRGLAVTGRVTGPDGAPVADARVTRAGGDGSQAMWQWGVAWSGPRNPGVASDAEGRFRLDALPPTDALALTARKPPLVGTPSDPVRLAADVPPPEIVLVLAVGASLSGTVLDADGKPVIGCTLDWWGGEGSNWTNGSATSDEAGAFRLDGLAPGSLHFNVRTTAGLTKQVQVTPALKAGEQRDGFAVRLGRTARVSGTTVDADGVPVGGIQLNASSPGDPGSTSYAVSQSDGSFVFPAVAEGPVSIQAVQQDEGMTLTLPAAAPREAIRAPAEGVKIVVSRRVKARAVARIVGPDGQPIPLCTVSAAYLPSEGFRMAGFGGGGDEVVGGILRREYARTVPFALTVRSPRDADGQPMNLRPKTFSVTGDAEIEVRLDAGRELLGRVVGPDGGGVAGVTVSGGGATDDSGADGSFRLRGLLPDGEVELTARVPSGWIRPDARKVAAGETSVTIPLTQGLAISGKLLAPDGEPVKQGFVQAPSQGLNAQVGAGGRFRLEGLAPGAVVDLTATAWDASGGSPRSMVVKAVRAGTEDLVIRFEPGVTIEGSVVDAQGQPAAQGFVMANPASDRRSGGMGSHGMIRPDGRFTIEGLRAGPYHLNAQVGSEGTATLTVDAPARDVRLVLPARTKITGRLLGSGDRSGFRVAAYGAPTSDVPQRGGSGRTEADGSFTIDVTGDGPFELVATKADDDRFARLGDVRPGGASPTLTLEAGLGIEGTVEAPGGGPLPEGTWVVAIAVDNRLAQRAVTASDGTFRVRGLAPGTYRLQCGRPRTGGSAPVEVEAGTTGHRLKLPGA